jgi:hypothetical protein
MAGAAPRHPLCAHGRTHGREQQAPLATSLLLATVAAARVVGTKQLRLPASSATAAAPGYRPLPAPALNAPLPLGPFPPSAPSFLPPGPHLRRQLRAARVQGPLLNGVPH